MKIRWQHVIVAMAVVYVLNHAFGWAYAVWRDLDIPMHILGGFLAALLGLCLWVELRARRGIKNVPPQAVMLFLLGFTALIAVLWEFHEFTLDWWHATRAGGWDGTLMQPSLADSMKDLADGLIGACLTIIAFNKEL